MRTTGASAVDELRAAFEEPFAALGSDTARDGGTVVISWPSVPVELVRAAGFSPVVARGSGIRRPPPTKCSSLASFRTGCGNSSRPR